MQMSERPQGVTRNKAALSFTFDELADSEKDDKSGYHQCRNCRCTLTTRKGAYRDVIVTFDDIEVVYYHQNPVIIKSDTQIKISSCGHKTKTTKERINDHLPHGYYVRQEDYVWYLEKPNNTREEFYDGMTIDKNGGN